MRYTTDGHRIIKHGVGPIAEAIEGHEGEEIELLVSAANNYDRDEVMIDKIVDTLQNRNMA